MVKLDYELKHSLIQKHLGGARKLEERTIIAEKEAKRARTKRKAKTRGSIEGTTYRTSQGYGMFAK